MVDARNAFNLVNRVVGYGMLTSTGQDLQDTYLIHIEDFQCFGLRD